jgi:type IV pilus assembly protein PilE
MRTKSSGFTLIELLVVVAILGIIAAIGISSYNGYVSGTKQKSVENAMMQMSLGQTEYYSQNGYYYPQKTSNSCNPTSSSTSDIEKKLLGDGTTGPDVVPEEIDYYVCVWRSSSGSFGITAKQVSGGSCTINLSATGTYTRTGC